jgi:hypothetical protein
VWAESPVGFAAVALADEVLHVVRYPALLRFLQILSVAWFVTSCGMSTQESSVKNFTLSCVNADTAVHDGFRALVSKYNSEAGFEALSYTANPDDANSPIYLSKGLNQREGKVGWGQWLSETEERRTYLPQPKALRTTSYSMRLELDEDFMRLKINSMKESDQIDVRKLFYHEVGHGMQMDHDPDVSSVMYYDISGDKDFPAYFSKVQAFFGK